jgi:predicted nucleic acid-binding protein
VFDAAALIALERNDRSLWAALKVAVEHDDDLYVPSTVVAQVWRGSRSQARLSAALQHCNLASFDRVARLVGELCGRTGLSDICDAHVAIVAATHGDVLYTSDAKDLVPLIAACGRRRPVIVPC